ncbi:12136_t:CDS:2, partial [Funneliformis caledonium]
CTLKERYQITKPVSIIARTISPSGMPGTLAKGLCIPANNSKFIEQLSRRLAVFETGISPEGILEDIWKVKVQYGEQCIEVNI